MSDDLVELEKSQYAEDEIGCYGSDVIVALSDNTALRVSYGKPGKGIWAISIIKEGSAAYSLSVCEDENADIYSDIFESEADVVNHWIVDKGAPAPQEALMFPNKWIPWRNLIQCPECGFAMLPIAPCYRNGGTLSSGGFYPMHCPFCGERMDVETEPQPTKDMFLEGVKYAVYELMKELDAPGSNEVRKFSSADDICAAAAIKIKERLDSSKETPQNPEEDPGILACQRCGSGEYLYNEDGNQNNYCGQCGQKLTWQQ